MREAINRIGIDIVSEEFHRVGMHIKRVFLRVILGQKLTCGPAQARFLIIIKALAKQAVLIFLVNIHHVAITFTLSRLVIVIKTVARNGLVYYEIGRASCRERV